MKVEENAQGQPMKFDPAKPFNQVIQTLILIVLFVTPFVYLPLGFYSDYFYAPKVLFYQGVVVIFIILLLFHRKEIRKTFKLDMINVFLIMYFSFLIISTVFAMDVFVAITGNPRRVEGLSTMTIYFMLFIMARNSAMLTKKHMFVLLMIGAIISIYGILQTFGVDPFPRDYIRHNWTRAFSTIGNPNFLGSYLVLLLPFATDFFVRHKHKWALLLYAILFYTLLATMTRGAWVGAGLSHALYFLLLVKNKQFNKRRFTQYVVVTVIVLLTYNGLTDNGFLARLLSIQQDVNNLIGNEGIEHLGSSRMFIWLRGLELVKARPLFGYGLENVGNAFLEFYRTDILDHFNRIVIPDKAHNEYLHIALTTGVFGLISYLLFLVAIIKKSMTKLYDSELQLALFVAIIGYLIQAFFNISVVSVAYVFWIFLGLSVNEFVKEEGRT